MSLDGGLPDSQDPTDPRQSDNSTERTIPSRITRVSEQAEELRTQLRAGSSSAYRKVEASAPPSVAQRMKALRERIRSRRSLDTAWRMLVFTLGLTLLLAGVLMLVIPGPGWATIILGLVVLASEFTWATRVLDPVKEAARRASEAALDPRRRRRNLILGAIAGIAIGVATWWYLATYGTTIQPLMDVLDAVVAWFRGLFS